MCCIIQVSSLEFPVALLIFAFLSFLITEEEIYRLAMMTSEEKLRLQKEAARQRRRRKKAERAQSLAQERDKLKEAKEFLRAAGIQVPDDSSSGSEDISDSDASEDRDLDDERAEGVSQKQKRRERREKRKTKSRRIKKKR